MSIKNEKVNNDNGIKQNIKNGNGKENLPNKTVTKEESGYIKKTRGIEFIPANIKLPRDIVEETVTTAGDKGPTGDKGSTGDKGKTGLTGNQGDKGPTGNPGNAGRAG